jgi:hypothetical protein
VDTGLDENEAELAVLVLAVALKVLADGNSLGKTLALLRPGRNVRRVAIFTFLIRWYRSSGISGARPGKSLCQSLVRPSRGITTTAFLRVGWLFYASGCAGNQSWESSTCVKRDRTGGVQGTAGRIRHD